MNQILKLWLIVSVFVMHTSLSGEPAEAIPFTSDLSISGTVSFDSAFTELYPADNVTQNGSFYVRQGGLDAASTFSGKTVTGTNPLSGPLSDFGDGFGITATVGSAYPSTFGLGNNIIMNLVNSSSTASYTVRFMVDISNNVTVAGSDSYAHSNYYIRDAGNNDIFYSDITRDTIYGDTTYSMPDSFFDVVLAPNSATHLLGYWTVDGGVYADLGAAEVDFWSFLGIQDVTSSQPPPVPEPATFIMLGTGLAVLGLLRRRSR